MNLFCQCAGKVSRATVIAVAAGLLVVGGLVAWQLAERASSRDPLPSLAEPARLDPRLAYLGPYRNVRPEVTEVGDSVCSNCHADITAKYARHPMGRSLLPVAQVAPGQDYSAAAHNPFMALGSRFSVKTNGHQVAHREERPMTGGGSLYEMETEIQYVLGSGKKGHSYLFTRDGYLFKSAVSWYSQKRIWDVSPGFTLQHHAGRPVMGGCIFCHTNHVEPVAGTVNRFQEPVFRGGAIGCERCHGPGSEHVRVHESGESSAGVDYSIVNPTHLEPALREAVCQQCHLAGEARVLRRGRGLNDYRPGMALEDVWGIAVEGADADKRRAVNHVEQMYQSRCFQASAGKLGCISCHDPHEQVAPEKRAAHFRTACLKCHDCTTPMSDRLAAGRENSCIACHMPSYSAENIIHTASTDHRILRRPERLSSSSVSRTTPGWVFWPTRRPALEQADDARDFALALYSGITDGHMPSEADRSRLLPALDVALKAFPSDAESLMVRAATLGALGRWREALVAGEELLTAAPDHEPGIALVANLSQRAGYAARAIELWRRAAEVNPWYSAYQSRLAWLLNQQGDRVAASHHAETALKLDPADAEARRLRVEFLLLDGRLAEADQEFAKVEALNPPQLAEWRAWFVTHRRSR